MLDKYLDALVPVLLTNLRDRSHAHSAAMRLEAVGALQAVLIVFSSSPDLLTRFIGSVLPAGTSP